VDKAKSLTEAGQKTQAYAQKTATTTTESEATKTQTTN